MFKKIFKKSPITGSVFYVPIPHDQTQTLTEKWSTYRHEIGKSAKCISGKKGGGTLSAIAPEAKLYVMIHGDPVSGRLAACGESFDASEFAELLEQSGLNKAHQDLRLFACYSGLATRDDQPEVTKELAEILSNTPAYNIQFQLAQRGFKKPETFNGSAHQRPPMAALLCSALKARGYNSITVTGYQGALEEGLNDEPIMRDGYPIGPSGKKHKVVRTCQGERVIASQNKEEFKGDNWDGVTWT